MKRFLRWAVVTIAVVGVVAFVVLEWVIKQRPFADADAYWAQLDRHELTLDVVGHWNNTLGTIDILSYSQAPIFPAPVPDPYDMSMMKEWIQKDWEERKEAERAYAFFADDRDYGWPKSLRGVLWMYGLHARVWAAPSIAIIEPGRTAEAAFVIREALNVYRSPAVWKDYVYDQGWGDPMRDNVMWKAPLLIAEGLYALLTGDRQTFGPEMQAVARDLYESQDQALKQPIGNGFSGGVCCEPNHWFPQCNAMAVVGMALYDKVYGKDAKQGVFIGEVYRNRYMTFLREYMTDPDTGLLYRRYHPYGPQQADKDLSGFSNVFVALTLHDWEPEFAENIYRQLRKRYIRRAPLGLGAFMLEVPEEDPYGKLLNPGADMPGMLGETAVNIYLALLAARVFDDKETFNQINALLTNLTRPYFRQAEVRFDETNDDPAGLDDKTVGQMLNMMSGWWMLAKVHLGWRTILEHDWSKHRTTDGRLLNDP
ncbi:MAG: hypothetical protein GXP27_08925 [Planctomycetes bacterium]|nr:hypothetical protein [Planctomycetota bacterium]